MKKIILVCLLLVIIKPLVAQQVRTGINFNMLVDTLKVRHYKYNPKTLGPNMHVMEVPVKFNNEELYDKKMLDTLNDGLTQVIKIDYIYTQYKDKKTQDDLNMKRLLELYLVAPNIFNQGMTHWRFIEQLGFTKDEDAKKLFHGFVIYFTRTTPYSVPDRTILKKDLLDRMKSPKDSLIANVFKRNPQFPKDLIVADFTCSMSPYYLDLLAWFCLQGYKEPSAFAFFNDGDGKANELKVIGATGGVHQFKTTSLDTIVNYVYETIKTGCSGDDPENDIEAILKGIEQNPNAREVILIADNWSDMRDFNLRYRISKPVHIILCGTDYGINLQYLNLAKETKGSIHTMTQDLDTLFKLSEGATFTLGGQSFIVKYGRIEKVNK